MSELRDTWMLKVFYPPKVTLTLGQALDAGNIKEGDDVYFECHLIANPWVSILPYFKVVFKYIRMYIYNTLYIYIDPDINYRPFT